MATITMKEMLDAGVHFGHQTQRWNPKMKPYVHTERGGIHIIDLQKTVVRANKAAEFVKSVASVGGKLIFVGTKKQAIEPVQEAAQKCGQYYVTKRWLGGMLTNFETIRASIDRLRKIDQIREKGELDYFTKKERAKIEKEYNRLSEYLNGIREMKEAPKVMFVVDLLKEHIAVAEARRMKVPVVGIADTNADPEQVQFPIPGNDDAIRSIKLFANLIAEAYLEGAKEYDSYLRTQTDKASDLHKESGEMAKGGDGRVRGARSKSSVTASSLSASMGSGGGVVSDVGATTTNMDVSMSDGGKVVGPASSGGDSRGSLKVGAAGSAATLVATSASAPSSGGGGSGSTAGTSVGPTKEEKRRGITKGASGSGSPGKSSSKKSEGPVVVKVSRSRKLVAAGLAEKLEIEAELEEGEATRTYGDEEGGENTAGVGTEAEVGATAVAEKGNEKGEGVK